MTTDTTEPSSPAPEMLTLRSAAAYIRDVVGIPMSYSTVMKLNALGEFATPARWWGKRPLFTREGLRAWVEGRAGKTAPPRPGPRAKPVSGRRVRLVKPQAAAE